MTNNQQFKKMKTACKNVNLSIVLCEMDMIVMHIYMIDILGVF